MFFSNPIMKTPNINNMKDDERDNLIKKKKKVLDELLNEIVKEKTKNKKLWRKYKKRDNNLKVSIHTCNAISISSIVSGIASINPIGIIIGLIFGSCSTIGSSINDSCNFNEKHYSCKSTACQLSDLEREIKAVLIRNHLTSSQIDTLIDDTNHRLSLIQDSSIL
jgi:hypothetical protein